MPPLSKARQPLFMEGRDGGRGRGRGLRVRRRRPGDRGQQRYPRALQTVACCVHGTEIAGAGPGVTVAVPQAWSQAAAVRRGGTVVLFGELPRGDVPLDLYRIHHHVAELLTHSYPPVTARRARRLTWPP
ncbi:MAG TPA: hypothetical protein VLA80_06375 [Actinomycetota bacterium]|nr:hypothetical protein [Actinomycetota bacterium]